MRKRPNRLQHAIIKIGLFTLIVGGYCVYIFGYRNHHLHENLISIMRDVRIGDDRTKVENIIQSHLAYGLRVRDTSGDRWWVRIYPAGDWELSIDFASDKVSCVRIRSSNDFRSLPDGAPKDKQSSNNSMHTNRRQAFQFRCSGFFGRWIRSQFTSRVGGGSAFFVRRHLTHHTNTNKSAKQTV